MLYTYIMLIVIISYYMHYFPGQWLSYNAHTRSRNYSTAQLSILQITFQCTDKYT